MPITPGDAPYKLVITKPGYLSYTVTNLALEEIEENTRQDITPLAGDVNGDGIINAVDLAQLLSEFNREPVVFKEADIDGNGIVNATDLTYKDVSFLGSPLQELLENACQRRQWKFPA